MAELPGEKFLDIIPDTALETLVRQLSDTSASKKWAHHMPLREVALLCRLDGEVPRFIQSHFHALGVMYDEIAQGWAKYRIMQLPESMLKLYGSKSDEDKAMFCNVLSLMAPYVRTLALGYPHFNITLQFMDSFTSLERLSILFENCALIKKVGPNLQAFEILDGPSGIFLNDLAESCTNLRELYLREFHWKTPEDGFVFWETLGPNLEKLSVEFRPENGVGEMEKIGTHCRKLKWLDLNNSFTMDIASECEIAHQNLLISYGAQLEYALLPVVYGDGIKLIAEACPNARFKIDWSYAGQTEILKAVGSQLIISHCIRPHDRAFEGDYGSFSEAWSSCPNLEVLYLWSCDMNYSRGAFASPKYRLKKLNFSIFSSCGAEIDRILQMIVNGTRALENFEFSCKDNPPLSLFEDLVRANRSLDLINITLRNVRRPGVEAFANVCSRILERRVSITVNRVQYC